MHNILKTNTFLRSISCAAASIFAISQSAGFDLTTATIPDIHAAVDAGELTYEKLLRMHIERIAAYEGELKSITQIHARALFEARELDKEYKEKGRRSMLHGIPMSLKDNIDAWDIPNSGGTLALRNSFPYKDSFVSARLREAGAIHFVRANLSEFASGAPGLNGVSTLGGQPRNSYNYRHHSDGSSSGTGSSLAAVFATVGIGTETGSSVRGPAMHNSIVGLAPTEGLVSRQGVIPNTMTLDRLGMMGRNVMDVAIMLNFCTGIDPEGDPLTAEQKGQLPEQPYESFLVGATLQGKRIGIVREVFTTDDPRCQEAIAITDGNIEELKKAGATVIEVETGIPDIMNFMALSNLGRAELGEGIDDYLKTLRPGQPQNLSELLADGGIIFNKFSRYAEAIEIDVSAAKAAEPYQEHLARRTQLRDALTKMMDDNELDGLFYLHNTYPAQMINESYPYTKVRLSSVSGLPAICLPGGYTEENLPVGMEFLSRTFDEPRLLALAYAFEQATGHRKLPKSTPPLKSDIL